MVWEIAEDQHTRPFTDPPDPNRVIVVVDGDEDRSSVCIGKYKGHGRVSPRPRRPVLFAEFKWILQSAIEPFNRRICH